MTHLFDIIDAAPSDVVIVTVAVVLVLVGVTDRVLARRWRS